MQIGDPVQLKNDTSVTMTVLQVGNDNSVQAGWFSSDKVYQTSWFPAAAVQSPA